MDGNGTRRAKRIAHLRNICAIQEQVCGYVSEQVLPHALNGEHICCLAAVLQTAVSVSSL